MYNTLKYVTNRGRINIGLQYFASMKNLDTVNQEKQAIVQKINAAVTANDDKAFATAFDEFAVMLHDEVMNEARGMVDAVDTKVLDARGVRQLTSAEKKFYESFCGAIKSGNPMQALTDTTVILPETVVDSIFDDIRANHPLLGAIRFQNTGWLTKILISTTSGAGAWGALTAEIEKEVAAAYGKIDLEKKKFTAYILIDKAMLDLGPAWVDRYVRELLSETVSAGMESGFVDGDGDDKPRGMTRALTGAVDGVYPRKTAISITALDQNTYATILNTLSQGPNGKRRSFTSIAMIVNPADYYTKVMPATTVRNTDGGFVHDVFPFPTTVYQSAAVPAGYAVFGLLDRYWAGVGVGSDKGRIWYDDSIKVFEDQRAYFVKVYGDGTALDANAFVYANISGLVAYTPRVYVANESLNVLGTYDARLSSLGIGTKTLVPAFNKSIFAYTCATTDATNTITAVSKDGDGTIEILNGETPVNNGAAATWATGANTLTINVTSGTETETYTVTVTKS